VISTAAPKMILPMRQNTM